MGYVKPTLEALKERAISELNSAIDGADAHLRRRVLNVIATICAGIGDEILRRAEYIIKQIYPQEADTPYLLKHGQKHKFPIKLPTKATGFISMTGTAGSVIISGTQIKRVDGWTYTTTEEAAIKSNGTCSVRVESMDFGADGNTSGGTLVALLSPIAGVNTQGYVDTDGITGGTDVEDIESYRGRLMEHLQSPPMGGSDEDYEIWAKEVAGVTRAWCASSEAGAGTVTIRFMMDNTYEDGIPKDADIIRVREYIDTKRPATAKIIVSAPIPDPVDIVFGDLAPDNTSMRETITQRLKQVFKAQTLKPGGTLYLSQINKVINNIAGYEDHKLISPVADVKAQNGHIPVLGTITYPETA